MQDYPNIRTDMDHASELALAERNVRAAEAIVERQKRTVHVLRRIGHGTSAAEQLLETFELSLKVFQDHLEIVQSEDPAPWMSRI